MKTTYSVREVKLNYRRIKTKMPPEQILGSSMIGEIHRKLENSIESITGYYLDGSNRLIAWKSLGQGTANQCPLHPREVFQPAIALGACSVILAHNHPSGDDRPSDQDIAITERLRQAGDLLGIRLLDHVIVTEDKERSIMR